MNYIFLISTILVIAIILGIAAFSKLELTDKNYDRLAYLVHRWSYIIAFVGLVAKTFNMPYGIETTTIVAGIGVLMAGLMDISTSNWKLSQPQITFNKEPLEEMLEEAYETKAEMSEER